MSRRQTKIQLQLSPQDQESLRFQNPYLEWDYKQLMRQDFTSRVEPAVEREILEAIRKDLSIPAGYLEDYRIVYKENILLVISGR